MKNGVTPDVLKKVMGAIVEGSDRELFALAENELEQYWHFKFDSERSADGNLYLFYDMLKLYSHFVRRWEEHHNGHCCVVERVRDKYLMPKIRRFLAELSANFVQQAQTVNPLGNTENGTAV